MSEARFISDPANLAGADIKIRRGDLDGEIAWNDHQIAYTLRYAAGKRVLNLGCVGHDPEGWRSRFSVHAALAQRCEEVVGVDLSAEGIAEFARQGYSVIQADAQNFDLGQRFDCIVCGELIEHLESFAGLLESCKRHLAPGGVLIFSTPNPWYWRNVVKAIASSEVPNNAEHTCWLCPRTLRQLVSRHGMELSDVRFGSRYPRDRLMPLPRGIKHTSWHGCVTLRR